jgi:DNA (cytosine-5)-methyltransferase 1
MAQSAQSSPASFGRTFVSLFCGCGGLDLGFVDEGFRSLGGYDYDPLALQVHGINLKSPIFQWDLSKGSLPHAFSTPPDVVLAGSPCQGFSTIGKRALEDKRNDLLVAGAQIALALRPRCFVAENVPGAAYGTHKKYLDKCQDLLKAGGYICHTVTLAASDFGIAQLRKRIFLVACVKERFLPPVILPAASKTLRDAIADLAGSDRLPDNHEPTVLCDAEKIAIARRISPGQKLSNVRSGSRAVHTWHIPEVFGRTSHSERQILEAVLRLRRQERLREFGDADPVTASSVAKSLGRCVDSEIESLVRKSYLRRVGRRFDLTHTFNGKYRRLRWDEPSFTVDTRFGDPRNFLHPEGNRGFSVREAARIQGFPDEFKFSGSRDQQFRFVGNAVPPPMAGALARALKEILQ